MAKTAKTKAAKAEKPEVLPTVCVDHDREGYHIEIELPGVKKEDIDLEMGEDSFCIRASKEELVYSSCYALAHHIVPKNVNARFANGLLTIRAPFKTPVHVGTKIAIK